MSISESGNGVTEEYTSSKGTPDEMCPSDTTSAPYNLLVTNIVPVSCSVLQYLSRAKWHNIAVTL
jgi:hypothetical protein